jgi:hypothetical protein
MCCDYRDIPVSTAPNGVKYNKITCLEMAEHVGVRRFNQFLLQAGSFVMPITYLMLLCDFWDL